MVPGGGSMFPHDMHKLYFEGFTTALKNQLLEESKGMVAEAFQETGWQASEIDHVFTHQVSMNTFDVIARESGISRSKFRSIFKETGNTGAASIPLAMHDALQKNILKQGDKILIVGLAAGVSISVQLMIW